jgi:hypothetical protein
VRVGRKRESNFGLPEGVRRIGARWYWQPPTKRERLERKAQGLAASVPLGLADSIEARTKWAVITGRRPEIKEGTVGELLDVWEAEAIKVQPNGERRADDTVKQYKACLVRGAREVRRRALCEERDRGLAGKGLGTPAIQDFITEARSLGRKLLAVLKNSYDYGIRRGRLTFNPCDKVIPEAIHARTREPQEWEIEALCTVADTQAATAVLACILAYKNLAGYRISEIIRVHRRELTAEGIRHQVKGGRWETCEWTPGTRAIVAAAEALPKATRFPASALFPNSRGRAYTRGGFYSAWTVAPRAHERSARPRRDRPEHARAPRAPRDRGHRRPRHPLQGARRRSRPGSGGE